MSFQLFAGRRSSRDAGIRKRLTPLFNLLTPLVVGLSVGLVSASTVFAAPAGTFRGHAFGTFANDKAGEVAATLGRSAFLACPCDGTAGKIISNRVDSLSAGRNGRVLTADEVKTTGFTDSTAATASVKYTSRVEDVNALGGLITANAIFAVSSTEVDSNSITGDTSSSRFSNLVIAGQQFSANVAPNTRVNLPGVGFVLLNKITTLGNGTTARITTVEMIEIIVTRENSFDLPIGSQIVIANATSGFSRNPSLVIMSGAAWATEGNSKVGDELQNQIGRAAFIGISCNGTNGQVKKEHVAELRTSKGILSISSGVSTAFGGKTSAGTQVRLTSTANDVRLLGGLIVAEKVTMVARETISASGARTRSFQGSGFVGLKVLGTSVPNDVPPNTEIQLPGFGFVILNQQLTPPPSSDEPTRGNGIHVFITRANPLGLPAGSRITVAHAGAAAKKLGGTGAQVMASGQ